MSLISVRNFLSPFRSKVQIGALLVLAFLAFVVRYGSNGPENRASEPNLRVATEESRRSSSCLGSRRRGPQAPPRAPLRIWRSRPRYALQS